MNIKYLLKKKRFYAVCCVALAISFVGFFSPKFIAKNEQIPTFAMPPHIEKKTTNPKPVKIWEPPKMEKMKTNGCVADGLLSGYNKTSKDISVVKKSNCYYLSRAIETWLEAPDFQKAQKIMDKIGRDDVLYGMFIAEAINKKEKYLYYKENRRFDFSKMCKKKQQKFLGRTHLQTFL